MINTQYKNIVPFKNSNTYFIKGEKNFLVFLTSNSSTVYPGLNEVGYFYNETENNLKLLVLDDFLTSLDMANRKIIAKYILDNFEDYQIIILTHNLQFNNLIKRLLDNDKWDTKVWFNLIIFINIK